MTKASGVRERRRENAVMVSEGRSAVEPLQRHRDREREREDVKM